VARVLRPLLRVLRPLVERATVKDLLALKARLEAATGGTP